MGTNQGETVDMVVIVTATATTDPSMGKMRKCSAAGVTGEKKTEPPPPEVGEGDTVVGRTDPEPPLPGGLLPTSL